MKSKEEILRDDDPPRPLKEREFRYLYMTLTLMSEGKHYSFEDGEPKDPQPFLKQLPDLQVVEYSIDPFIEDIGFMEIGHGKEVPAGHQTMIATNAMHQENMPLIFVFVYQGKLCQMEIL